MLHCLLIMTNYLDSLILNYKYIKVYTVAKTYSKLTQNLLVSQENIN